MDRAARRAPQIACISVQEARRASSRPLSRTGVGDAVAAVAVIACGGMYSFKTLLSDPSLVHMLHA